MQTTYFPLSLVSEQASVLHQVAAPVFAFDNLLRSIVEDMKQVMRGEGGIGLAAPQVGVAQRIIILMDLETRKVTAWINPVILQARGWMWHEERLSTVDDTMIKFIRVL